MVQAFAQSCNVKITAQALIAEGLLHPWDIHFATLIRYGLSFLTYSLEMVLHPYNLSDFDKSL